MSNVWPSITDYDFAVENLSGCLLANKLLGGRPAYSSAPLTKGWLVAYSGGYSVVYRVQVDKKTFALRCWTKDAGNVEDRYTLASAHLGQYPCEYLVEFGYARDGILVKGSQWPISYMTWVEGSTLCTYLDEKIHDSPTVNQVAEAFRVMVATLHARGISHGDLQDGNIMVSNTKGSVQLRLVDYDSLFVSQVHGTLQIQEELPGVKEYQHPKHLRRGGEKADYFSELVIYLSLRAYAEAPWLWRAGQEKQLLFTAEHFEEFRQNAPASPMCCTLQTLSPDVQFLAARLVEFCKEPDPERLLPLEQVLSQASVPRGNLFDYFAAEQHYPAPHPSGAAQPANGAAALEEFFHVPSGVQAPVAPEPPPVAPTPVQAVSGSGAPQRALTPFWSAVSSCLRFLGPWQLGLLLTGLVGGLLMGRDQGLGLSAFVGWVISIAALLVIVGSEGGQRMERSSRFMQVSALVMYVVAGLTIISSLLSGSMPYLAGLLVCLIGGAGASWLLSSPKP